MAEIFTKRNIGVGAGAVLTIAGAAYGYLYLKSEAKPTETANQILNTPTVTENTQIVTQDTPTTTSTTTPEENNYIQNGMTGAIYMKSQDPENKGRQCVTIGRYSKENPATLVGAAVAVGSNNGIYIDTDGEIYLNGTNIGSFDSSHLPNYDETPANSESVVCANN